VWRWVGIDFVGIHCQLKLVNVINGSDGQHHCSLVLLLCSLHYLPLHARGANTFYTYSVWFVICYNILINMPDNLTLVRRIMQWVDCFCYVCVTVSKLLKCIICLVEFLCMINSNCSISFALLYNVWEMLSLDY